MKSAREWGGYIQIRIGDTGRFGFGNKWAAFFSIWRIGTQGFFSLEPKIRVSPEFAERRILRRIPERSVFSELTRRSPEERSILAERENSTSDRRERLHK